MRTPTLPPLLRRLAFPLLLVLAASVPAGAQITFAPLPGVNGSPYLGHTEAGFDVTPLTGQWSEGHAFGNPVPSVFGGPIPRPLEGALRVTRSGGGLFTFGSVDLASSNGLSAFLISGLLSGGTVFSQAGSVGPDGAFTAITANLPAAIIDELTITLDPDPFASSFNVDNIGVVGVTAVPEPATLALVATGLLAAAGAARRARRPRSA